VIERLGGNDGERLALFRAAQRKRERLQADAAPKNLPNPPTLALEGAAPLLTAARTVPLRVRAQAGSGELRALHVTVNSVPVTPLAGTPLSGSTWSGEVPIALGSGSNRIEVYAKDDRGAASAVTTQVVERTGKAPAPALYAVVVGVSKYANPKFDLAYAAKDAKDVAALLATSDRFSAVHVREVLDDRATRDEILATRTFLEKATVDDTVVVFFAGHGLLDKKLDYYFATTDIDPRSPAVAGLSYEALSGLVTGLEARRRIVMLDTCHAGEADTTSTPAAPAGLDATPVSRSFRGLELERSIAPAQSFGLMQQLFADLRATSGAIVVGSSGGAELALESARYKNGVFTFALLEALKERRGDVDRDGGVSATELVRYVRARVEALTGGKQRPVTRGENLDLDFAIH
jgi:hypothetical protein